MDTTQPGWVEQWAATRDTLTLHADIRPNGTPSVLATILGGNLGTLITNPNPHTTDLVWAEQVTRALLTRRPDLTHLDHDTREAFIDTLITLAEDDAWAAADSTPDGDPHTPVTADQARADITELADSYAWDLDAAGHHPNTVTTAATVINEFLTATEAATTLADALDAADSGPAGLELTVRVAGMPAVIRREPDGNLIIELFGGCGGVAEGLAMLGRHDIGLEWDPHAAHTRTVNGHPTICTDVAAYPTAPFTTAGGVEGIWASAPCPTYSSAGNGTSRGADLPLIQEGIARLANGNDHLDDLEHTMVDQRGMLTAQLVRYVRDLRPIWVGAEQVPGADIVFADIAAVLRAWEYRTITLKLNAADYGLPQTRIRLFLLAHRRHQPGTPTPTHARTGDLYTPAWNTMADALGWGLTDRPAYTIPAQRPGSGPRYEGGSGARHQIRTAQLDGRWKPRYQPDGSTHPADHAATNGSGRLGAITTRDLATLQGFRDDYTFTGTTKAQATQIGNAVPPPLARAIFTELLHTH